jgi:hypothetical protein
LTEGWIERHASRQQPATFKPLQISARRRKAPGELRSCAPASPEQAHIGPILKTAITETIATTTLSVKRHGRVPRESVNQKMLATLLCPSAQLDSGYNLAVNAPRFNN